MNARFILGTDDFKVGNITFELDTDHQRIVVLTITGDQETYRQLSEDEAGNWNWTPYPSNIGLRNVPYVLEGGTIAVEIDDDLLDECDISLYLMNHGDVFGRLTISENGLLKFMGTAMVMGTEMPLELEVMMPNT